MRGDRVRRPANRDRALEALRQLHEVDVNFDYRSGSPVSAETGWRVDDYCVALPPEPPGAPLENGSWQVAKRLLADYEFADPQIVRAVYDSEHPLDGRTMLLEGRFFWMRFLFGVRVGEVVDDLVSIEGRNVRVWGWNYRTLEGHLERGQLDYEICKWTDTGEVEFRMHVVSRAAEIPNPVIRIGFRVFGRHMQKKFLRQALKRMRILVESELVAQETGRPLSDAPESAVGAFREAPPPPDSGPPA
ncbi:MAG TPA: DUF1990 family protein [Acidimicrobiales bacterium]|nr:DUF1990 family protein [Acidimicrobiales bacterium]